MTAFELPADWSEILDGIHRALSHASQLAQEREDSHPLVIAKDTTPLARDILTHFSQRLQDLDRHVEAAAADIAAVDEGLSDAESQFRTYLKAAESLRGRLELFRAGSASDGAT